MPWVSFVVSNILLSTPLALCAWGAQRWGRHYAFARILWVGVLIKLLTPPLVSISLNETPASPACREGLCGCPHHQRSKLSIGVTFGLLGVWVFGAATTGWTAWGRWSRFEGLLAHAAPAPLDWQTAAERLSVELSIRRSPRVLMVPGQLPPMVVPGWGRLRLLVPRELVAGLGESQRTVLLLHELIHIRSRDHWVRLLELAVRIVYWWLPVVGFISRQLRTCEEICCDAAVVSHRPQARRDYAGLLLDVIDFVSPMRPPVEQATGMSTVDDLEQRLRGILHGEPGQRGRWPVGWAAAVIILGVVPWGVEYDWIRRSTAGAPIEVRLPYQESKTPSETCESTPELSTFCCPS